MVSPPIPTGRNDRGGGGTVGGDAVGAWRPRASVPQTMIIDEKCGFQATPTVPAVRDPTHEGSVHEVWGRDSTRHHWKATGTEMTHERVTSQGVICMHGT